MKNIYIDFNDWFSRSPAHGMSSSSRDWMEDIWNDLKPTIESNQNDYKKAYLILMKEISERETKLVDALFTYIEEHKQENQQNFFAWWSKNHERL